MELLKDNIIKIAGVELDGFSWVKIPVGADYAIVKKNGEESYRVINCVGKLSKPFTSILQIGESGLTLVKDNHPDKPYRFIDDTGTFSERYADVSTTETTFATDSKTGKSYSMDKSGKKLKETELNNISSNTRVRKIKDGPWVNITDEFTNLPLGDNAKEPAHFYCIKADREEMLDCYPEGYRIYSRYFTNQRFTKSIRKRYKKQLLAELIESEAEYYNSNRARQKQIENSGKYYLQKDLPYCMKNVDKRILDRQKEARAETRKNIKKLLDQGILHKKPDVELTI